MKKNWRGIAPEEPWGDLGDAGVPLGAPETCTDSLSGILLDEAESSEYVRNHGRVPPAGTPVEVRPDLESEGRLVAETEGEQQAVGYLPLAFSYLLQCFAQGTRYGGRVVRSSNDPPEVELELSARA